MKWDFSSSMVTLLSASLLCLSSQSFVSAIAASSPDDLVSIFQTFREPKKIAFAGALGGSSHFNWVLSIMDELADRGHNASFFTMDDALRFGKPYPNINTVSIGAAYVYDREALMNPENRNNMLKMLPSMIKILTRTTEQDYTMMVDVIKLYELDVILCDHFFEPCINAAIATNIPFIVTSTADITKDSDAPYINSDMLTMDNPTTENMSIWTRFNNKFVIPLRLLKVIWPQIQDLKHRKKALGITASGDPTTDWKDSIKLVNNLFGLMPARPLGPLVEAVGPITPKKHQPLNEELKAYLDSHRRVAYVAFGQNAIPTKDEINKILTAIMESIESGDLDGFLWATVHAGGHFPDSITTSSNTKYSVIDMIQNKNPSAHLVKWAPQTAVLLHPSTYMFVSHGGYNSWVESLYAGVRMIMFPFFGDQPANAKLNERAKVGGILEQHHTAKEAAALFKKILKDEDGEIEKGVKRFQALVQIHSSHSIMKGADVIEEVAFVNVNGKLPHRYPASRNMNFFKAHNFDIYGLLAAVVSVFISVLYYTSKMIFKSFTAKSLPNQKKAKNL